MLNLRKRQAHTQGMTFIEITIALLIIGGFMAFVMPALYRALTGSKRNNTTVALNNLKVQISQYHSDTHQWPTRLRDLVTKPADANIRNWHKYAEEDDLYDAWGQEFVYRLVGTGGKKPFELYSWGSDTPNSPQEEWVNAWE